MFGILKIFLIFNILPEYMFVASVCLVPWKAKEGIRSPGTRVRLRATMWVLRSNLGPEELPVLSITEPFL